MNTGGQLFNEIVKQHDLYLKGLHHAIAASGKDDPVKDHDRIDRVAFHVIEEIIEMRRTYPHKFWKQSEETINKEALIEEAADIYLMSRSMFREICDVCQISEEQFLQKVLKKILKNQARLAQGY